ncbi:MULTISPECIES: alpha/beta hydrolase [unclassified Gordonia (in: high G+C Gram-positive bacteria)]|uniref:alpha/beta hydrolase n=1 Tax=unclassified Gordonia (in: high G+C Gram-positive bacteria) TaxID=2657482 RepID=UPI001FFE64C2|nr:MULTISPECIES: alpha/beta hydrolase [unclassified Gordonia (in: high G+C Gram-positive bacteria)]UQE74078.1 alpha/beta hydrolase [Gordonia sp. PP30]
MTSRHSRLRTTLVTAAVAAALAAGGLTAARVVADPQVTAPAASPTGQTAGAIYANQPIPAANLPAAAASGQRYTYWTNGLDEQLHLAIATILEPQGKAPAGGWPVIVNAPAGNGVADTCAASADPAAADRDAVNRLLRAGYAVLTPDYGSIGQNASPQYVDHAVTARNLVDAMLAGVVVDGSVSPRWAVVGDAQGAGAAITLARKATDWQGRNLDFRGAAATSIPAGLDELVAGLRPDSPAVADSVTADVVYALASLPADNVQPLLSATGQRLVTKAKTTCAPDLRTAVHGIALGDLVTKALSSSPKVTAAVRRSLALPSSGYDRPLLLSQTLQDDSVLLPDALRFLADAQLASNKVRATSYMTGDQKDGERQEQAAVSDFLGTLF